MRRPRLPVEFAMFSAGVGLALLVFGGGMAAFIRFGPGGGVVPVWTWKLAGAGLGLFLLTAAAYLLRLIQFVRQRGVDYDPFFWDLPIEDPDHPKDFGDIFDEMLDRWPWLVAPLLVLMFAVRWLRFGGVAKKLLDADLGPIRNGGEHWSVGDVVLLGGGSVFVVFFFALVIRRVWAMQRRDPRGPS